jgi:bifunctional non-homologous end joining protein LigD
MMWRYPNGVGTKKLEEKAVPRHAPTWVARAFYKDKDWIVLNDLPTLIWVANYAAMELHVPFDRYNKQNYPTELIFDLDPPGDNFFELVLEVALKLRSVLNGLDLFSVVKTSGATGLQIHVPIEPTYTFEQTRRITKFVADYMQREMPDKITLERVVNKRGQKLYFDYLQLWKMRSMPVPYSARARNGATVAAPVSWEEIERGIRPADFTIRNMPERIKQKGDLFSPVTTDKASHSQNLDGILSFLDGSS